MSKPMWFIGPDRASGTRAGGIDRLSFNAWFHALLPWLVPCTLLILWQAASSYGMIAARTAPAPADVIKAGYELAKSGELFRHLWASFLRAATGFVIGGSIGFAFGLLNGVSRVCEMLFDTTLQMIRNIPHLAMVSLVILWFGIDEAGKLFLVSLGVMFPIYLNTFHGVRSVDRDLVEMGRAYGLRGWRLFRQIILPGALPSILVGVRFSLGFMWLTLIVAETISAPSGIGYMAMNAREFMQTDIVAVAILLYALLGKLGDLTTRTLERRWLVWHPNYTS